MYNRKGESLGSTGDVVIDNRSRQVSYAITSFGGFLGMGESCHPLPWRVLEYDERQGGYVVDPPEGGAVLRAGRGPGLGSGEYGRRVDDHYVVSPRPIM